MLIQLNVPLVYVLVCRDRYGRLKWRGHAHNLTTTEGKNSLGNVYLRNGTQIAAWYVGLKNVGAVAVTDTAASHAGWTEFQDYTESDRQTLTLAAFSGGTSNNTAAPAVFNINATGTVAGAFVASVATKGSGSGVLLSVADFSASLAVEAADELTVSVSVT